MSGINLLLRKVDEGVILPVKVVPGSSKTAVAGLMEQAIRIKVSAAPEKGKANQCLVKYLSKLLGVRKQSVSIVSGQTSPLKQVLLTDISIETIETILQPVVDDVS